jgi:hypothetical protein
MIHANFVEEPAELAKERVAFRGLQIPGLALVKLRYGVSLGLKIVSLNRWCSLVTLPQLKPDFQKCCRIQWRFTSAQNYTSVWNTEHQNLFFWLRRLHALKADEARLKEGMDCDVALVIKPNNILLWEEMLKSVDYPDLSVVSELRDDTDLVGCAPKTGLWPSKFQPASKSHLTNCMTLRARSGEACVSSLLAVCEGEFIDQVWNKTMEKIATWGPDRPNSLG